MLDKDNLVPLDAAQSNRAAPSDGFPHRAGVKAANTRRMSAAAVQLKEFLHRQLSNYLHALFDKFDDALFDLLMAVLRNSSKRIVINRSGSKAAELDVNEIAQMLESGEMLLLENAQLFDKALTSIIDGLRKQQCVAESA